MSDERKGYESYEQVLEDAALIMVEIADIFKPAQGRQKKIYEGLFEDRKNKELALVRDCKMDPEHLEYLRDAIVALFSVNGGLGMSDNLEDFFAQAGLEVKYNRPDDFDKPIIGEADKIAIPWNVEFSGDRIPNTKAEAVRMLLAKSIATKTDIKALKEQISDLGDVAEGDFSIPKGAWNKAVDIMFASKTGGSVEDKLAALNTAKEIIDKAMEPWT